MERNAVQYSQSKFLSEGLFCSPACLDKNSPSNLFRDLTDIVLYRTITVAWIFLSVANMAGYNIRENCVLYLFQGRIPELNVFKVTIG